MRRLIHIFAAILLLAGCRLHQNQQIDFFTHEGCPYCIKALQYIKVNYPSLPIRVLEISDKKNMRQFIQCAEKFKLNKKRLGTPLICFSDHYVMGWAEDQQNDFNRYVEPYLTN